MTRSKEAALSIDRTRRLVLLSVWTVVLLGVPLWWKTTRVYRAELPQEDIEKWSRWEPCRPSFPLKIQFHVSNSKPLHIDSQHIDKELSARKGTPNPPSTDLHDNLFSFLTHTQPFQPWAGSTFSQIPSQHSPEPGTYDFYLAPTTDKEGTRALIKSQRQGFIQVETWDEHHIVKAAVDTIEAIFGPQEKVLKKAGAGTAEKKGKDQLRFVKYAPGYQLTFSLFSGDASNGVRGWRVQEAINAYLTPFLRSMSVISKFSIESQVQHYASLTFEPQVDPLKKEHFLTPDSLSNFINAAEWSLASTVSSYPALNFLVYIPKPSESPLVIKQAPGMASTTDSFLIPRWGGITILNHASHDGLSHDSHNETVPQAKDEQTVISVKELEPVMNVFLSQLRDLLGVPELSSLVKANAKIPIQFQRHGHAAVPTAWELDYLLRLRWAENVVDSLSTLGSLARLVADTPNMVVLDPIHKDVVDALKDIEASCQLMSSQAYVSALARSRDGLEKAEAAFFDPTMVSMLYFPDEH
ncbi:GPI transamidase component, partial [Podila epigama]